MNKLEIMKQRTVDILLAEMIKHQPGISVQRLWETTKEWYGKTTHQGMALEFDMALGQLLRTGEFHCTNKRCYPKLHVAPPQPHSGPKSDPRQVRMDW